MKALALLLCVLAASTALAQDDPRRADALRVHALYTEACRRIEAIQSRESWLLTRTWHEMLGSERPLP